MERHARTVDNSGFYQVLNPEEVEYEDYSIGDSSDSSIKVSTKHVKQTSK